MISEGMLKMGEEKVRWDAYGVLEPQDGNKRSRTTYRFKPKIKSGKLGN